MAKRNYDAEPEYDSKTARDMLEHTMQMVTWEKVDFNNPDAVKGRVLQYLKLCADDDMKPTVEGLAFAFDITRTVLQRYVQGAVKGINQESMEWFRRGYDIVTAQLSNYMYNGKINTVAGIFLMKNNMGYEDRTVNYIQTEDSLGAMQTEAELLKRIAGGVPGGIALPVSDEQTGSPVTGDGNTQDLDTVEIDGRTPEAFMDLLPEAETEE